MEIGVIIMTLIKNRYYYLLLTIITIIIGLASRRYAAYLPKIINLGLGDLLWAMMIFWIIAFLYPNLNIKKLALYSLGICFIVEFSQLIQINWLIKIRNNPFGRLILGQGFLWSDLIAYSIGITFACIIKYYLNKILKSSNY